jgi:hypothetical protein
MLRRSLRSLPIYYSLDLIFLNISRGVLGVKDASHLQVYFLVREDGYTEYNIKC